MGYEFDFHQVGSGERSGDAISARFVADGYQSVIVIDGGTREAGLNLVDHINRYYETNYIDHVVLTHADDDHSSGLREVLKQCEVGALWIKRPWCYAEEIRWSFKNAWTSPGLAKRLRNEFPIVAELEEMAIDQGIPIHEPFAGSRIGPFIVLSPTKDLYLDLLPHMTRTPEPAQGLEFKGVGGSSQQSIFDRAKKAVFNVFETAGIETLQDGDQTSASNESSVVLYGEFDGKKFLTTGDAGEVALELSANVADQLRLPLRDFSLVMIPHHGSRRNVGPTILNRLIGPIQDYQEKKFTAVASASTADEDHPRRVVLNAFKRRGAYWVTTEGRTVNHRHELPLRTGWTAIPEGFFFDWVEE